MLQKTMIIPGSKGEISHTGCFLIKMNSHCLQHPAEPFSVTITLHNVTRKGVTIQITKGIIQIPISFPVLEDLSKNEKIKNSSKKVIIRNFHNRFS
jgi:hypothetical protein